MIRQHPFRLAQNIQQSHLHLRLLHRQILPKFDELIQLCLFVRRFQTQASLVLFVATQTSICDHFGSLLFQQISVVFLLAVLHLVRLVNLSKSDLRELGVDVCLAPLVGQLHLFAAVEEVNFFVVHETIDENTNRCKY